VQKETIKEEAKKSPGCHDCRWGLGTRRQEWSEDQLSSTSRGFGVLGFWGFGVCLEEEVEPPLLEAPPLLLAPPLVACGACAMISYTQNQVGTNLRMQYGH
jgi:hypothetical protein